MRDRAIEPAANSPRIPLAHAAKPQHTSLAPFRLLLNQPDQAVSPLAQDIGFLIYHGVQLGPLMRASERAKGLGLPARHCLVASGALSEAEFADKLAHHHGVARIGAATPHRRTVLAEALRQGWFRARTEDGQEGEGQEVLVISALGVAMPVILAKPKAARAAHVAVATEADMQAMLLSHFGAEIAATASNSVPDALSARRRMTDAQATALSAAALLLIAGLVLAPAMTITLVPMILGLVFLGAAIVSLLACWEGWRNETPPIEMNDSRLPNYSVLVPLHREGPEVIGPLVDALGAMDYPREMLQILLVVETGDMITQAAIAGKALPPNMAMFIAPDGAPRTKPRALNAAMPFVTGDFTVIYDAEDRPDPRQLRKAAAMFRSAGPEVACLQARLAIDNPEDGLLPAMFRIEYAALFDVTKSGSARLGHPIPLGGTSNHFRTSVLREVGLWDAWNVTEDADLGFRLARLGYKVGDLSSTTDEEAPEKLKAWMAQRSRWLKGWMQTVLTHSRAPVETFRQLGPVNALVATALSLGVIIGTLFGPVFHALVIWRVATGSFLTSSAVLDRLADASIIVLGVFGFASVFLPAMVATQRRDLKGLRRLIPLLPLYHLLMAAAGWRAVYELVRAPHQWNKTTHGLARSSRRGLLPTAAKA